MKEYIITFLPGQMPDENLFRVEMVGITYPDDKYQIIRKNSKVMCLEYVIRGKGEIFYNNKWHAVLPGDVYVLPMGKDHFYRSSAADPWEKIWMNVQGILCDTLVKGYGLEDQVVFRNCPLYPLFSDFLSVCEGFESRGRQAVNRASLLFVEIMQRLAEHKTGTEKKEASTVWRIKEYIDAHIYEKLTASILANQVNLSVSQAGRLFKQTYGKTPYEYVMERKIATACLLLENTGFSVKEIAFKLNYADEHYFCNIFRSKTGKTPGEHRAAAIAGYYSNDTNIG